ncbi:hypothetical protein FRC01_002683 [Tulasnella sp. 417]|nr:hypothetical protein FRC01_002683 [Tulasnella sp. 417]
MVQGIDSAEAFMRAVTQFVSEPNAMEGDNGNATAADKNAAEPPVVPGLAELVEVLSAMAAAPQGVRPKLNLDLIERIKNSPLHPVLKELQPVYKKLGPLEGSPDHLQAQAQAAQHPGVNPPTPQPTSAPEPGPSSPQPPLPTSAALNADDIKNVEVMLTSLSSKLDSISHAVTDVTTRAEMCNNFQTLEHRLRQADSETLDTMKASANAAKTQLEVVDRKISQISGKLDPLPEVMQRLKKLEAGLLGDAKTDRIRLESKNKELETEVKELLQIIHDASAELLPVEVASKAALQGAFTDESDTGKPGGRRATINSTNHLLQTAKKVRANTLGLISKCHALVAFINHDIQKDSDIPDLGTEGEWGRCTENLRGINSKLRRAVEEKEETTQKLQFVGFVIDQIRKSDSIQFLTQDSARLPAQSTAAFNDPVPSDAGSAGCKSPKVRTAAAPSKASGSPSDLDTWDSLS